MVRQVAIVDATGRTGTHTGAGCVGQAGHQAGNQVSVQANMMERDTVWAAMIEAYEGASGVDLAERLVWRSRPPKPRAATYAASSRRHC